MSVAEHKRHAPRPETVRVAVVTVSDTRTEATDDGGRLIRDLCTGAGFQIGSRVILRDEPTEVAAHVSQLALGALEPERVDAILITGGTGLTRRDTTIEALAERFDKTIDGFGELFRMLSFQEIGAAAMLSRATAGIIGRTAIFLMPGSPAAVKLALERLILPELGHLAGLLNSRPSKGPEPPAMDSGEASSPSSDALHKHSHGSEQPR